jgi:putative adenylate-forming enzyme
MTIFRSLKDYWLLNRHLYHFSEEEIRNYQLTELIKLTDFASQHSSFYHEAFNGRQLLKLDDFDAFPTINKQIMMAQFDDLNTCGLKLKDVQDFAVEKELKKDYYGYYNDSFVVGLSSGTSGNKGIYITPKAMTKRLPAVFLARSGLSVKYLPFRILFLLRVFSQGFDDINTAFMKITYRSTMTEIEELIETINSQNINILMAPPSMLRLMMPQAHLIKVKLKKVITYAEVFTDEDKVLFAKAFKTSIIQIYQASEGQIASSCKAGTLHINEDLVYVELYDELNQPINAPGVMAHKMIVTNLVNTAQPLIRYEMNDLIMLGKPCPCGSHFRTILKVAGRRDDILYFQTTQGKTQHVFPDLFSRWIITCDDAIREFKVIQEQDRLDILVDLTADYSAAERIHKQIIKRINEELAVFDIPTQQINVINCKLEQPQNSGKYKRFEVHNKSEEAKPLDR